MALTLWVDQLTVLVIINFSIHSQKINIMNPYLGQMIMFAGNFAPRGWSFCNGQLLPIPGNEALFSLLGTIYGGDGRTTFALPDMRGRVPVHMGSGLGLSPRNIGVKGGAETTRLITSNLPPHTHTLQGSSNAADQKGAVGGFLPSNGRSEPDNLYASSIGTAAAMGDGLGNTGADQNFNNEEPYLSINYIIALQGIYPSRY